MADLIAALLEDHQVLRGLIQSCSAAPREALKAHLEQLRSRFASHLPRKEQLYRAIEAAAKERNDAGSASIAHIFEDNMRAQAAGVAGFFDQLESAARQPEQLEKRSKTVLDVIRTRLDTEERAVFPIFKKLTSVQEHKP